MKKAQQYIDEVNIQQTLVDLKENKDFFNSSNAVSAGTERRDMSQYLEEVSAVANLIPKGVV